VEAEVEAAEVEAEAEVKAAEAEVAEVQVVFDEEEKEPPATSAPSETAAASALHERPPEHASLKTPRQAYVEEVCAGRIDGTAAGAAALLLPAAAALDEAEIERLLCECEALYRADQFLLAMRRLLALEALASQAGLQPPLRERDDIRVSTILRTEAELESQLNMIASDEWRRVAHRASRPSGGSARSSCKQYDLDTYVQELPGGRMAVKVVGVVPRSIECVLAPLLQPELYGSWIPGIKAALQVCRASNFRRFIHIKALTVPIPFLAPRHAVLTGYGDILSATSVMCYIRSIDPSSLPDEPARVAAAALTSDSSVAIDITGGFLFEVLSPNETRVSSTMQLDPKLKLLPPRAIDWFMKHVAANLIPMYDKMASKFEPDGQHAHLMVPPSDDAATYEELRRRLAVLQPDGAD